MPLPNLKIAALIQAHHKPENLAKLLRRLSGPLWQPIVHLDAKSNYQTFRPILPPSLMTSRRIAVHWGGMTSVKSMMVLLRHGLTKTDCTHFYLMSGQCYPIKSDDYIRESVSAAPRGHANWMTRNAMPRPDKPIERYTKLWACDLPWPRLREPVSAILRRIPPLAGERMLGLEPFGGSAWWMLERSAASSLLLYLDSNPWLLRRLSFSFIPDEWLPQTISNHLNIKTLNGCPTKTLWQSGSEHPEEITPLNFEEASSGWHFMARKFDRFYPSDR